MEKDAAKCINAIKNGKKIFICGNGGSAAQANHFAAELIGKYKHNRKALPAISLCNDTSSITAIANDFSYSYVFVRQLEALANYGDVLIALSTSGRSENVLEAIKWAKKNEMVVIDLEREGDRTPLIQEYHLVMLHELAGLIEESFL